MVVATANSELRDALHTLHSNLCFTNDFPSFLSLPLSLSNAGSTMEGMNSLQGVLSTLASLFKHAKRDDVVEFAPTVLSQLSKCDLASSDNTLLRKLNIKLVQVCPCSYVM